jgi:hypothetical protein
MQDCAMRTGGEGFWAAEKIRQVAAAAIKEHILRVPFPNNREMFALTVSTDNAHLGLALMS